MSRLSARLCLDGEVFSNLGRKTCGDQC